MKKIKLLILTIGLVFCSSLSLMPVTVGAVDGFDGCSGDNADTLICNSKKDSLTVIIKNIANILMFLLGAVSVLMIIFSGVLYVTSQGDAGHIKKAKDTLMYAVIGLIVALLAAAIVNFVITAFTPKKTVSLINNNLQLK